MSVDSGQFSNSNHHHCAFHQSEVSGHWSHGQIELRSILWGPQITRNKNPVVASIQACVNFLLIQPLKMEMGAFWKRISMDFLLETTTSRCYVSFREGIPVEFQGFWQDSHLHLSTHLSKRSRTVWGRKSNLSIWGGCVCTCTSMYVNMYKWSWSR